MTPNNLLSFVRKMPGHKAEKGILYCLVGSCCRFPHIKYAYLFAQSAGAKSGKSSYGSTEIVVAGEGFCLAKLPTVFHSSSQAFEALTGTTEG